MPKVSVIIPTHNRPNFLVRALNSVYRQTFQDFEVIVVDDGDKPRAKDSLTDFVIRPNFTYLETAKNTGGAATRNLGISIAKGEYLAFLDDDDEWLPEKLDRQLKALAKGSFQATYVFSSVERKLATKEKSVTNVPEGEANYYERALSRFAGTLTSSLLVKREELLKVGNFDEALPSHQEAELLIRLSKNNKGIGINQPLVVVHEEGHSHIGGNLENRIEGRKIVLAKHAAEFCSRPKVLAKHLFNIGLWQRDLGRWQEARANFIKAFKFSHQPRYFFHLISSVIRLKPNKILNILLILGSLAFSVLLVEIGLRLILPIIEPTFKVEEGGRVLRSDPVLGFSIVPNSSNHDKNGFKNETVLDNYPIVALGDSHTYGVYGKKIDWPHFLSTKLNQPVYNLGVWGYGPAEYRYLMKRALDFKPQTVIVALYLGNDLFNAYDAVYHRDYWSDYRSNDFIDESPVTSATFKETKIPLKRWRDFFRDHSVLYAFLGDRTRAWRERLGLSKARNVGVQDWSNNDPEVSLIYDKVPAIQTLFWSGSRVKGVDLEDKKIIEGERLTQRLFREMKLEAWSSGAEFIVMFVPSKELVYAPLIPQDMINQNHLFSKIIKDESLIKDRFESFCAQEGIRCVDITPSLTAKLNSGEAIYQTNWDEHPNEAGYGAYAEAVYNLLIK